MRPVPDGGGATRLSPGPFDYYRDLHGVDGPAIAASADVPEAHARTLTEVADDLELDRHRILTQAEGDAVQTASNVCVAQGHTRDLAAKGLYAVGLIRTFARDVEVFDSTVSSINADYHHLVDTRLASARQGELPVDAGAIRGGARRDLLQRYRRAESELDGRAHDVAHLFRKGLDAAAIITMLRSGLIPLSSAYLFPTVHLSPLDIALAQLAAGHAVRLPEGASPAEVTTWWRSLSADQRAELTWTDPALVGNTDGIPVVDRDRANRILLPRALDSLERQLAALGPRPAQFLYTGFGLQQNAAYAGWTKEAERLQGLIAGTEDISKRLDGSSQPPYFLIGFRPGAGNGQAIVSHGNPDTADHVSTFVPGTTSKLAGIDGDLRRSDDMRSLAQRYTDGSIAAVTWYDYQAPQSILPDAAELHWAKDGGPELAAFQAGLHSTHEGSPAHSTVVGHSYGTTVVGYAASHGQSLAADDVVMVASPGSGVGHGWIGSGSVDDLHLDGHPARGHVYATRAEGDPIKWAVDTHLGTDPTDDSFGAHEFDADPQGGHSDYWTPNNPALKGMAEIIAGHGTSVPETPDDVVLPAPIIVL